MRVSRSELSCLLSIQRESWVTVANAMSSSLAGRETPSAWLRTNRSCATPFFTPGIIGSHLLRLKNGSAQYDCRDTESDSYYPTLRRRSTFFVMISLARSAKPAAEARGPEVFDLKAGDFYGNFFTQHLGFRRSL